MLARLARAERQVRGVAPILHLVTGALLHELSSIPVIANSARLIGRRERS